jgi:uncharacterized membrane protein
VSTPWGRRLQHAAVCTLVVAYAGLSHYCNSTGAHELGAALALTPLTLLTLVVSWRGLPAVAALAVSAAVACVLLFLWPLLARNFSLFYLIEESSVYGILGLTFSRSLLPRGTAVCTRLADEVHGPLAPQEVRYTRQVTAAWSVFFFTITTVSILLYLAEPVRIWSIYINFCVAPLIAAMFVGEYLVRRRVLPQIKRVGVLASIRVYFASPQ